jgi:YidC/Oxa1 family membrane protein insertase
LSFFREWRAYRAFRALPRAERRIVFLAESHQDWHHFKPVLDHLTGPLGETVLYVCADAGDPAMHQQLPRIRAFCVGKGLPRIWFCQFVEADVLVTQILDLGNLELKRSVHPVQYVFMAHSLTSTHMADRADSYDHYDTILMCGPHMEREIRRREEMQGLPAKRLVPHGYGRLDELIANRREPPPVVSDADIHVLLAPSWGPQMILNVCGMEVVDAVLAAGFRITLRPHYQTRWQTPELIDRIVAKHGGNPRFALVEQMAERDSPFDSHVMITDWSGAGQDYGMGLEKPVIYIDLPLKSRNDAWAALGMEPFESYVRDKLGALLPPAELSRLPALIRELVRDPGRFRGNVAGLRAEWVYNVGRSGIAGAEAIAGLARELRAARS